MASYVVMALTLFCVTSLQHASSERIRDKRNVDSSIHSVLQSFLKRIDEMKALVRKQNNMITKQSSAIKRLGWTLRRKGNQDRLDEIERDLKHQYVLLQHEARLQSLTAFKNSVDKSDRVLQSVTDSIKVRSKIANDIYDRLIIRDRRIDCKIFLTSWKKQAGSKIGALSKHFLKCPNKEFLQSILFQRKDGGFDSEVRYKYRCCRFNIKDKWVPGPRNNK